MTSPTPAPSDRLAPAARLAGLDAEEAARRLRAEGPNRLAAPRRRRLLQVARDVLREPMFLLLLAAVAFYFLLGDIAEALFLLGGAVVTIGLVVVQEARSERALAALRALAEPVARVVRNGRERSIAAAEIVRGDLVLVGEGGRVPADGVQVAGDVLSVDESVLTGESAPVIRSPAGSADTAGPDQALAAGALVVRGQGLMLVSATGPRTRLGGIGAALAEAREPPTPLQAMTRRLVGVLGVCALAFALAAFAAHGLLRGDWIGGALAALTLGIALVPEEFPMVLAVFLALGGWRLARGQVLVRRMAAIEALGSISVLCVDKTGTLTRNRMGVAALWRPPDSQTTEDELVQTAVRASQVRAMDPMDRALLAHARRWRPPGAPLKSYPLRPDRLAFIQAWPGAEGVEYAAKGAPETIFDLSRLGPSARREAEAAVSALADRGLRVLGVARASAPGELEDDPGAAPFRFVGLAAFEDPVRPEVPAALAEAVAAGIRVVMITGDFQDTARAIGRAAGLAGCELALTGAELAKMDDAALREAAATVQVFARISPEQKLRLVRALQANGDRVAMFGDGVNDAPALEAAHVGVAMGRRGVDVAREAADLILLDDRFASIVAGIAEGRRIFDNLRAALAYLLAVHLPMVGLALLPPLIGSPAVLFPMQVVLLELVIDPMCALVFEGRAGAADLMRRPPRSARTALMSRRRLFVALGEGLVILAGAFSVHLALLQGGEPPSSARAASLAFLVTANLGAAAVMAKVLGDGAPTQRKAFAGIAALALGALGAALYVPWLAQLFAFTTPSLAALGVALGGGLVTGVVAAAAGRRVLRSDT